jgi:TetR/AcrR family transcriptional regulator
MPRPRDAGMACGHAGGTGGITIVIDRAYWRAPATMNADPTALPVSTAQEMPAPDGPLSRARPGRERIMAAIRAAAVTEFSLHGLKGTSTQAIAARAGLTKPQLHYYIAGKEELYEELLMQVLHAWKVVFSFEDASDPATVLGDYIRKKLDHAIDSPEMSRIFTREILDGGRNLDRYWPNARAWTQKKIDVINGWIARGQMRPLDARILLMHIWAMTQSYADYAIQTRVMLGLPPDAPFDREPIARELVAFVLHGCGIEA